MVNKSPRTTVLNTIVLLTKDIPQPVINFQEVGDGTEVADEIIKTKKGLKSHTIVTLVVLADKY